MNSDIYQLHPYPFQKIASLTSDITPNPKLSPISLAIGEPKHPCPDFIKQSLIENIGAISSYPLTKGIPELRSSIADWLIQRFNLPEQSVNPDMHVLPVNGTREALFAFAQAVVTRKANAKVLMPNPFYQIYEGATLLAGAKPVYLACTEENRYIPDFDQIDKRVWDDCQLLYLCSPGNPTGAVIQEEQLQYLIELSDKHDFVIASDECYSELYFDEEKPPVGLLEASANMGNADFKRCVVFHSLSKRSNAPGLRSGFVAGDAEILDKFLLYRTYHGCAMPVPTQQASIAAWQDEDHVFENRQLYRQKFDEVLAILQPHIDVSKPDAGFYLWPKLPIDDEVFITRLLQEKNVSVVPGKYLAREVNGSNPGANRIRMALVATVDECTEAAERIKECLLTL